jgi:hypothetical protein
MRQGIKRGEWCGQSRSDNTAPRALTRQRRELQSREVDGEPGDGGCRQQQLTREAERRAASAFSRSKR